MRLGAVRKPRLLGKQHPDTADENTEETVMERPSDNILRSLNIPLQIVPNDDVYSAQDIDIIRFQVSKPEGYFFGHVDEFVKSVKQTLTWYESALETRSKNIYKLVEEVDRLTLGLMELKTELEDIHQQGGVFVETTTNTADLERQIAELTAALDEFEAWAVRVEEDKAETEAWVAEATAHIQSLEEAQSDENVSEEAFAALHEEIETLQEQLLTLQAQNEQSTTSLPEATQELEVLQTQLAELTQWSEDVQPYIKALEQENALLKATVEEAETTAQSITDAVRDDLDLEEVVEPIEPENMSEDLDALYAWIEEANTYIQSLESENETLKASGGTSVATPTKEAPAPEIDITELQDKLEEFETYANEVQAAFDAQTEQIDILTQALKDKDGLLAANEAYIITLVEAQNTAPVSTPVVEDDEDEYEDEDEDDENDYDTEDEDEYEDEVGLPSFDEDEEFEEEPYALPDTEVVTIGDEQSVAFLPAVTPEEELEQEEEFENILIEMLDRGPEHDIPLSELNTEGDYLQ